MAVVDLVEYLSLGVQEVPGLRLTCVPRARPTSADLYLARLDALARATGEYVCWIDGYGDRLLPGFDRAMHGLAAAGKPLGYAAELVRGRPRERLPAWSLDAYLTNHTIVHHGVVCRRADLLRIDWPGLGPGEDACYLWEIIAYGTLAQGGVAFDPVPRYDWRPGPNGASLWADTLVAVEASKAWLRRSAAV